MPNLGVPASFADIPTGLKCVKMYIPDGTDVHLYALRGQLSNLGKAWWWDTGGDVDLARTIASWWIAASEATDLTAACEDCDMDINVNVNCGCGGAPTTLYCYGVDGLPVITPQPLPPTEPTPPPGTTLPLDPVNGPLPDGYTDWTEYDSMACLAANMLWWWAHGFLRIIETMIDGIAVLAVAITLIIPLLPAGIIAAIGGATLLEIIWQLVQIVTSEQATDIINEITDWMETERDEIVCYIFQNRHDFGLSQGLVLAGMAGDYVELTLTVSPEERNYIQQLVAKLFAMTLFWGMIAEKLTTLATGTTWETDFPAIDCAYCFNPSAGINLYPFEFINIESNDFVSAPVFSGNELSLVSGRTGLNPTCRVRFNPNLPFGFSVGTGNAGCQAILMEVVSTSGDAQYIFPDGIVDSSQHTFIQPGLVLWKFQELQGQNVTGDELALWASQQTLSGTIQDDTYPVELTELRDHVAIYTYDKAANISLRFWFVVLVNP